MGYKPDNYQSVIANLMFKDARKAAKFYEAALGAENVTLMEAENGWVMHGEMWVDGSVIFFGEEVDWFARKAPTEPGSVAFYIYTPDVDASYERALKAGMTSVSEPETMFWGDRTAVVSDPFHYSWTFSTQVATPTKEEMDAAAKEMFGGGN